MFLLIGRFRKFDHFFLFFFLFLFLYLPFYHFLPFLIYKAPFLLSNSFRLPLLFFFNSPSFSSFPFSSLFLFFRFSLFLFFSFCFFSFFSFQSFFIRNSPFFPLFFLGKIFVVAIISLRCILTKSIKVMYSTALYCTSIFHFNTSVLYSPCSLLKTKKLNLDTIYFNLTNTLQHTGLIESYGMMCCT